MMWPGCNNCGASVPITNDQYCGGEICVGESASLRQSVHSKFTKKKITKKMIKARRKMGRK